MTKDATGKGLQVLAWDWQQPDQGNRSNRPYYTTVQPTRDAFALTLDLKGLKPGSYAVQIYRTGFRANDAQTAWLEMGKPKTLTPEQVARLQAQTLDKPEVKSVKVGAKGTASVQVPMRANDVVLVKIGAPQR